MTVCMARQGHQSIVASSCIQLRRILDGRTRSGHFAKSGSGLRCRHLHHQWPGRDHQSQGEPHVSSNSPTLPSCLHQYRRYYQLIISGLICERHEMLALRNCLAHSQSNIIVLIEKEALRFPNPSPDALLKPSLLLGGRQSRRGGREGVSCFRGSDAEFGHAYCWSTCYIRER